jgi:RNA polymerase sigma-70 factor (ECF subfamily)
MFPAALSSLQLTRARSLEVGSFDFSPACFAGCDARASSAYRLNMRGATLDGASDESLMVAYARGDAQAFRLLFARLAPRIHAFFRRSFGDATAADDLLQATFLKIHTSRDRYRSEFPLRVWVFTIAARARLDELRRRYRLPAEAGEEQLERVANASSIEWWPPMDASQGRELAGRVREAVDQLPETQRVVVHLNRFEGMTFAEIAQVLGSTEGAVKLRAFRAYETLRNLLRECHREEARTR